MLGFLLCVEIPAVGYALRKDMRFVTLINAVDANFDTLYYLSGLPMMLVTQELRFYGYIRDFSGMCPIYRNALGIGLRRNSLVNFTLKYDLQFPYIVSTGWSSSRSYPFIGHPV